MIVLVHGGGTEETYIVTEPNAQKLKQTQAAVTNQEITHFCWVCFRILELLEVVIDSRALKQLIAN